MQTNKIRWIQIQSEWLAAAQTCNTFAQLFQTIKELDEPSLSSTPAVQTFLESLKASVQSFATDIVFEDESLRRSFVLSRHGMDVMPAENLANIISYLDVQGVFDVADTSKFLQQTVKKHPTTIFSESNATVAWEWSDDRYNSGGRQETMLKCAPERNEMRFSFTSYPHRTMFSSQFDRYGDLLVGRANADLEWSEAWPTQEYIPRTPIFTEAPQVCLDIRAIYPHKNTAADREEFTRTFPLMNSECIIIPSNMTEALPRNKFTRDDLVVHVKDRILGREWDYPFAWDGQAISSIEMKVFYCRNGNYCLPEKYSRAGSIDRITMMGMVGPVRPNDYHIWNWSTRLPACTCLDLHNVGIRKEIASGPLADTLQFLSVTCHSRVNGEEEAASQVWRQTLRCLHGTPFPKLEAMIVDFMLPIDVSSWTSQDVEVFAASLFGRDELDAANNCGDWRNVQLQIDIMCYCDDELMDLQFGRIQNACLKEIMNNRWFEGNDVMLYLWEAEESLCRQCVW